MDEDDDFMDDLFKDEARGGRDGDVDDDDDDAAARGDGAEGKAGRKVSSMSDMDDLFKDDETGAESRAAGGAAVTHPARDRGDSELDNLFNDIGLSSLSPKTPADAAETSRLHAANSSSSSSSSTAAERSRVASGNNSFDDVDTFLQDLDMGSLQSLPSSERGNSKDKDDFLSWLEDKPSTSKASSPSSVSSSTTGGAAISRIGSDLKTIDESTGQHNAYGHGDETDNDEDDEEDEIAFYVNQAGDVMTSQPALAAAAAKADAQGQTSEADAQGQTFEAAAADDDEPPTANVLPPLPVLVEPRADATAPAPPALAALREQEPDAEAASQTAADAEAKILTRLETLFEIGQTDAKTLQSALHVNNVAGLVVPASRRSDVWLAVLGARKELPEWAAVREERLSEVLSSTRKSIRRDCAVAWAALNGKEADSEAAAEAQGSSVDELAALVCRFTLRQATKVYHSLLCDLAASVYFALDQDVAAAARALEAISLRWGGRRGDWRSLGLYEGALQDGLGVGGAAWARRTVPLTELRRHALITRLLLYHDPQLGAHLLTTCKDWALPDALVGSAKSADSDSGAGKSGEDPDAATDSLPATDASATIGDFLKPGTQRFLKVADDKNGDPWPSSALFGLLSLQGGLSLSATARLELWDALVVHGLGMQPLSFFAAAALLIVQRDELLAEQDAGKLAQKVQGAAHLLREDAPRAGARVGALAKLLSSMTPRKVAEWAAEDELLLVVPSQEDLGMFDYRRMRAKDQEAKTLAAYAARHDPGHPHSTTRPAAAASVDTAAPDAESSSPKGSEGASPTTDADAHANPASGDSGDPAAAGVTDAASSSSAPSSASTTSGWLSSAFKKTAQDLRTAVASSLQAGKVPIDFDKVYLKRRLVEFNGPNDEAPGLGLRKGKHGLEVASVAPRSMSDRSGLIHPGDLVMTLNGHLVFGLSPSEADALMALQERPFYIIVATLVPKELEAEIPPEDLEGTQHATCAALMERIEAYYSKYNRGKERDAARIARIYSHREAVLLEELSAKYDDHLSGDPFVLPLSDFCLPVAAEDVVRQVCFKEQAVGASGREAQPSSSAAARKVFVVDCRPRQVMDRTGRFPTAFVLDPADLGSEETRKSLADTFAPMRGDMHICVLGSGTDALISDFNPRRARFKREMDRRRVDRCALYFIELGFPLVGVVDGGFLACYRALRRLGYHLEDALINVPADKGSLAKYDAYERYRNSPPSVATKFLASKASSLVAQRIARASAGGAGGTGDAQTAPDGLKPRSDTAVSFSELSGGDRGAAAAAAAASAQTKQIVGKASQLFSSYWKKPEQTEETAAAEAADPANQQAGGAQPPAPPSPNAGGAQPEGSAGSKLFASMWKRTASSSSNDVDAPAAEANQHPDAEDSATETASEFAAAKASAAEAEAAASKQAKAGSSWSSGWSSRFKLDTSNLGSKLKTSMNQAYTSAQQKLAAVASEAERAAQAQAEAREKQQKENDQKAMDRIAAMRKGDLVGAHEFGRMHRTFEALKEKTEEKLEKPFEVKRMLVVTPDRFLVLDPHPMRPGFAYVKSARTLKEVVRMRFPNNDPTFITLFFAKEGAEEPVARTYRFAQDARAFVKALMGACANYNSRHNASVETTETATKTAAETKVESGPEPGPGQTPAGNAASASVAADDDEDDEVAL